LDETKHAIGIVSCSVQSIPTLLFKVASRISMQKSVAISGIKFMRNL